MQKTIVSDTSCLILLYKIGEIELLQKVFGTIFITETVLIEFRKPIPNWIQIRNPKNNLHVALRGFLDDGEATSISLATEYKECLLIIDELKGRKIAKELEINFTGTLGVIITAKNNGIIESVKPILEKISNTDFRLSNKLIEKILFLANEK